MTAPTATTPNPASTLLAFPKKGHMTRTITLDLLRLDHPLWTNPRTVSGMSDAELDELGDDLLDRGQQLDITVQMVYDSPRSRAEWPAADPLPAEPVVVRDLEGMDPAEADPSPDSEVDADADAPTMEGDISEPFALVLDGQRRVLALTRACKRRKKGLRTVEVKVSDYSEGAVEFTAAYAGTLFENITAAAIHRKGLSSYEQLEAARKGLARGRTMAQAAKTINRSESWVSRMNRAYDRAGPSLIDLWKAGKVTDEYFKDLADVKGGTEAFPFRNQEIATQEALAIQTAATGREAKTAARHLVKEKAAEAKQARKAEAKASKPEKPAKPEPAAKGKGKAKAEPEPTRKDPPAKVTSRVFYAMGQTHKPLDPYVKGFMAHAAYDLGEIAADQLASSFRSYLKRASKAGVVVPDGLGLVQAKRKRKK